MPVRPVLFIVLIMGVVAIPALADDTMSPCLMQADHLAIRLPTHGFSWLYGEDLSGTCAAVPKSGWLRKAAGSLDLFVYSDGPAGSGRYWTVMLGVAARRSARPDRGVCLMTSTVGWRTLQRHEGSTSLPCDLVDLDSDGVAELVIWNSFPLHKDASMAEYGLAAWVYRLASDDSFSVDWNLSRAMARMIAREYRAPLESASMKQSELRAQAAEALERFAEEKCSVQPTTARKQPVAADGAARRR